MKDVISKFAPAEPKKNLNFNFMDVIVIRATDQDDDDDEQRGSLQCGDTNRLQLDILNWILYIFRAKFSQIE